MQFCDAAVGCVKLFVESFFYFYQKEIVCMRFLCSSDFDPLRNARNFTLYNLSLKFHRKRENEETYPDSK